MHAPADVLWGVLTDFSSHANLMPNLEQCEQLPSRKSDTELLFQKVFSQTPFWRLEASAMLEYRQKIAKSWRKMNFWMISGDFAELSGHWVVAEDAQTPSHCILRYEIVFLPMCKAAIPCAMKQFLAKQVLPYNIMTLAAHAEQLSQVLSFVRSVRCVEIQYVCLTLSRGTATGTWKSQQCFAIVCWL